MTYTLYTNLLSRTLKVKYYSSTNYWLCIALCVTYIYSSGKVITIRIYTVSDLWLVQRCFKRRVIGSFLTEKVDQTAIFMGTRTKWNTSSLDEES